MNERYPINRLVREPVQDTLPWHDTAHLHDVTPHCHSIASLSVLFRSDEGRQKGSCFHFIGLSRPITPRVFYYGIILRYAYQYTRYTAERGVIKRISATTEFVGCIRYRTLTEIQGVGTLTAVVALFTRSRTLPRLATWSFAHPNSNTPPTPNTHTHIHRSA